MKKSIVALSTTAIILSSLPAAGQAASYTVQQGDSLHKIAQNYQTSISAIKETNGLTSNMIFVKQKLIIPTRTTVSENKPAAPVKVVTTKTYKVVAGDSLYKIATKLGVSISELKKWNGMNADIIYPNQQLKVSASGEKSTTPSSPTQPPVTESAKTVYTVQKGDTLGAIAQKHRTTVANLKAWNKLSSDMIYVNQKLQISSSTGAPTASPTKPPKPVPSYSPGTGEKGLHTVQSGDTLGKIAAKYVVTVAELKMWNNLSSDMIYVNQKLAVSKGGENTDPVENNTSSNDLLTIATKLLGTPYTWAGTTPSGFDCSGFIYYVFNQAGKNITRTSTDGYYNRSYYIHTPKPGDLVFFENTYKKGISHMGIYIGDDQFIHASESGGVVISSIHNSYWKSKMDGYKRFY
jgi:LysM repeat protein